MLTIERNFIEGAARAMFVQAWADREENPPEGLRQIEWHDRTASGDDIRDARGTWEGRQCTGAWIFRTWPDGDTLYLFDDEIDNDEPAERVSFAGQELMDVAPPTPDYARLEAARLLGKLEAANGNCISTIMFHAARADAQDRHDHEAPDSPHWKSDAEIAAARLDDGDAKEFGHCVAMQALGHGVSWFDDHARFELKVPRIEFELE